MALILTIDPAQDIADIIWRLSKANLQITSVMPMINIIVVEASASEIAEIEIIPGIVAIENDREIRISHEASNSGSPSVQRFKKGQWDSDLDSGFTSNTIN